MARQLFVFSVSLPFHPSSISSQPSAKQHFHLGNWAGAAAPLDRGHVRRRGTPLPLEEADGSKEGQIAWIYYGVVFTATNQHIGIKNFLSSVLLSYYVAP